MTELADLPRRKIEWRPAYRLVPSRFPPVDIYERVALPEDLAAVFHVEALTDDRLREEQGLIRLVPPEDRIAGPGTACIMAAFTRFPATGSRFSDGSFGVLYAAKTVETALAETIHHQGQYLRESSDPPQNLDMRLYCLNVAAKLVSIAGLGKAARKWLDRDSYAESKGLGVALRQVNEYGIHYPSVRHEGGECVGLFRPPAVSGCRQSKHYVYEWDGRNIVRAYEKRLAFEMKG